MRTIDLVMNAAGQTTGEIHLTMQSPSQKEKCIQRIRQDNPTGVVVYVGDSINDYLALFCADIGIVLGNNSSFTCIAAKFGIVLSPLENHTVFKTRNEHMAVVEDFAMPTLYKTSDWSQIEAIVSCRSMQLL